MPTLKETVAKLKAEQEKLAARVSLVCDWLPDAEVPAPDAETRDSAALPIDFVAGCDVTFLDVWKTPTTALACVKLVKFPQMEVVDEAVAIREVTFPYVPGLLAYRELPVLLSAYLKLPRQYRRAGKLPKAVIAQAQGEDAQAQQSQGTGELRTAFIVDGQGIAHYRRMGIASHFGLLTDEVSIGCAKSRLVGRFTMPSAPEADLHPPQAGKPLTPDTCITGEAATESALMDAKTGDRLGTVLRVRALQKRAPASERNLLFISPGHRVDFAVATAIVRACLTRYIQPEPTRLAHNRLQELRRGML